ncbi:hypothetical protein VF14_22435 [Nostoc linckia z18]|nr:hypothetical protein VF02_13315 [Nostoc linckia z1]PHJ69751.1 hypothetical protein VF05_12530 [Nostoc linckia z3]PHJ88767.1 hypothetical protein VF07_14680 [Nostoc linckia z6]PHK14583.1 hypothetical protein VF11_30475 [Nostoc linckia z14]PHK24728.1 hypothetical protein VF10_10360 [Nostoc linckia z13]PHK31973.1 hypothetical protein VF14_22435 [Nostoc linckia z18]PHK36368.1 hypothetical protein VF12_21400 [Nostoc linckia z15]PHK45812.1 hypothetical protein VF13_14170 [Nostoc linckia z16]
MPVDATKVQINATKMPVDATKAQINATKMPVDATKIPVDATKVSVDATKVSVDATKVHFLKNRKGRIDTFKGASRREVASRRLRRKEKEEMLNPSVLLSKVSKSVQ